MAQKEDKVQVSVVVNSKQAINELGKLEMEANDVARAMKGMKKGSDEYVAASKKLAESKAQIESLRSSIGTAGMTMQQLTRQAGELKRALNNVTRGTDEYKNLKTKFQEVNKAIRAQRDELAGTNTMWSKMTAEAKQFGMMALTYLGFQELIGQIGNLIGGLADLSDAMADVQKTTGLTAAEVEELNSAFKKIDTRTSRKELLGLAEIAGKLGVKGKEDVEGFVKSADQLVVALGKDLGTDAEGAIRAVGKLVDIFKVKEEFGLEKGLLKVGSAINSLGAASTASEGYLVDFAKRLGGIAPNANISISQVLGLGATLDQLGQSSESSSTAVSQLFVALAQDIPAFAKLANTSVKEFTDLLATDANEAFIKVLEGSKSTTGGLAGMAGTLTKLGIDGSRAAAVVGVLSNNIDLLRDQQKLANDEFVKGTSLTDEFAVKNNNLAAVVEKLQKRIAGLFINANFMNVLQNGLGALEKMTRANHDYTDGLRDQEKQLRKQHSEFTAMLRVLMDTNTTQETRAIIIKKLNEEYADYLPSVITEATTAEELSGFLKDGNAEFVRKIYLMKQQADLQEKINKMQELEMEIQKEQNRLAEGKIKLDEAYQKAEAQDPKVREKSISDVGYQQTGVANPYTGTRKYTNIGLAADQIKSAEQALQEKKKSLEKLQTALEEDQKLFDQIMMDRFGETAATTAAWEAQKAAEEAAKKAAEAAKNKGGDFIPATESQQKKYDDLIQKWKEFLAKIKSLEEENALARLPAQEQEFAQIDAKYVALLNEAAEFHKSKATGEEEYLKAVADLRAQWDAELASTESDQHQLRLEKAKEFHGQIDALQAEAEGLAKQQDVEEIERIKEKYAKLLQTAEQYHNDGILSEAEYQAEILRLKELELGEHLGVLKSFQDKISAMGAESELDPQLKHEQEVEAIRLKYDQMRELAEAYRAEGVLSEEAYNTEIARLNAKHNEEIKASNEAFRQEEARLTAANFSQMGNMFSEFGSLIGATSELVSTMGAKGAAFQKQLALFQIGIEMASATAKAISAALSAGLGTGAAAPFTTPIFVAQMLGIVIGGFAKARALTKDNPPAPPSFASGGYAADKLPIIPNRGYTGPGMNYTDSTGKRPAGLALLHGNEYIVPEDLLFGNQYVADSVQIIEAMRTGRSFAKGGYSGGEMQMPAPMGGASSESLAILASKLSNIEEAINRLDKPMRAYLTVDDGDAYEKYKQQDNSNRQISRL